MKLNETGWETAGNSDVCLIMSFKWEFIGTFSAVSVPPRLLTSITCYGYFPSTVTLDWEKGEAGNLPLLLIWRVTTKLSGNAGYMHHGFHYSVGDGWEPCSISRILMRRHGDPALLTSIPTSPGGTGGTGTWRQEGQGQWTGTHTFVGDCLHITFWHFDRHLLNMYIVYLINIVKSQADISHCGNIQFCIRGVHACTHARTHARYLRWRCGVRTELVRVSVVSWCG